MVTETSWTFFPNLSTPVTSLDIVWCHFPLVEDPDDPAPKARPALVRRVLRKDGNTFVEVAYGTSNARRYSEQDLWIANYNDMREAGLPQATIFILDRTVILPWSEEWFSKRPDVSGPVVGHLSDQSQEYLRALIRHYRRPR